MDYNQQKESWLAEERQVFKGWDFSYIANRIKEQSLPWDYRYHVIQAMKTADTMLDMGTGGGEFLLSLKPTPGATYATESYQPNIEIAKTALAPHGIALHPIENDSELPFLDSFFDLIINRHESFCAKEVFRVLRPGGTFITQQVGGENNKELSCYLLGEYPSIVDANFNLKFTAEELIKRGFQVANQQEFFPYVKFFDLGALVYLAKIIEWEFPGFSVEQCFERLCQLQNQMDEKGYVESREHRFFIIAVKDYP